MRARFVSFLIVLLAFSACRDEFNETSVTTTDLPEPTILIQTKISGIVEDTEGNSLSNIEVHTEFDSTTTDANGMFVFTSTNISETAGSVVVDHPDYFTGAASANLYAAGDSYMEITMLPKGTGESFSSNEAVSLTLAGGLELEAEPGALLDEMGNPFNGEAVTFSTKIDLKESDAGKKMPGSLVSIDENGEAQSLLAVGMYALTFESATGESLLVDTEKGMKISIPVDAEVGEIPVENLSLFEFDVNQGGWYLVGGCEIESGYYTFSGYSGSGYICVAQPVQAICLSAVVKNEDGTAASYLQVVVEDMVENFTYWGYIDVSGKFCGSVPTGPAFNFNVIDQCGNTVYSEEVGPFTADTDLGMLVLDVEIMDFPITISGTVAHCDGAPFTNGQLVIMRQNTITYVELDSEIIDLNSSLSCSAFPDFEIGVYSADQILYSGAIGFMGTNTLDLGDVQLCESYDDFFQANIDGVVHWFAPAFWETPLSNDPGFLKAEGNNLDYLFELEMATFEGLGVDNTDNSFFVSPNIIAQDLPGSDALINTIGFDLTVDITLDDGDFVEGTLTGSGLNPDGGLSTLTGNFRLRKRL